MSSTMPYDPRVVAEQSGLKGAVAAYRRRIAQGDIGQLAVVIGLVVIWVIFEFTTNGIFFSSFNLVNLTLQMAAVGTISVGVVFVLLLGEIDLSVGIVSGLCAAVMAIVNVKLGLPAPIALVAGLGAGTLIGLLQGSWFTRFGIPSFVVTLAGLIGWQGALLFILGNTGTVNLTNPLITSLAGTFFKGIDGWILAALFVAYFAVAPVLTRRRRIVAGLSAESPTMIAIRVVAVAVIVFGVVAILQQDRGVPLSLVFLLLLIVIMDNVAKRTRFGRMIFAIGGNAEAARRAGIPVNRVRIAVFAICSTLAAWGGILAASRLLAVNQTSGGGDVLLNSIAAAVIGGTSLFGGRGTVWAALLGVLVIQSISNGMDLLSLESSVKFMITGLVLLAAVTIDAVARRGRQATGRG